MIGCECGYIDSTDFLIAVVISYIITKGISAIGICCGNYGFFIGGNGSLMKIDLQQCEFSWSI